MKKTITTFALLLFLAFQTVSSVQAWQIERPSYHISINETVRTANTNGKASVSVGVATHYYRENDPRYDGSPDFIHMNMSMAANSRKGITYHYAWENLWWIEENELAQVPNNVVGDECGEWVTLPGFYAFRFWGGPGSAQYTKVWITSNGFISFDPNNLTNPNPPSFPSTIKPNAVIAAVWSDLEVDGSSSIITGLYEHVSRKYFVVIWKNVKHKASGQRLTFQIILRDQTSWYAQSHIWISYQSVSAINTPFAVGIEDHEGYKGRGGRRNGNALASYNGQTLHFTQNSNTYLLKSLKLGLSSSNSQSKVNILDEDTPDIIRGYNVRLKANPPPEPDPDYLLLVAFAGTTTLLLGGYGGIITTGLFYVDSFLVYMDSIEFLAYHQYSKVDPMSLVDMDQDVYIKVPTEFECVDATLGIGVDWLFYDSNNVGHSLTITATATYAEYDTDGMYIQDSSVSTSVNLNVVPDAGNTRSSARVITSTPVEYRAFLGINLPDPGFDDPDDYYRIYVHEDYLLIVDMIPPENANFDIYLYYGNNQQPVASSTDPDNGDPELISYQGFSGYYYVRVKCELSFGLYNLHINRVYHPIGPPPPGPLSANTTELQT